MSTNEVLEQLASGKLSVDEAAKLLPSKGGNARVLARRTAKGSLWMSLGYKAEKGCQNSATLPRKGWEAIVGLVKDGTLEKFLGDWDNIPLSASAS
jgi:hypothetical protein